MRPVITPEEAERRLQVIFPKDAFDTVLSNPLAGMAIAALLYIDAVSGPTDPQEDVTWARPSTVIWMSSTALASDGDADRVAWRTAAAKGKKHVELLLESRGATHAPAYAENSRETLRDETFHLWREHGAMRMRSGLPTSSSKPRWALMDHFADLFNPELDAQALVEAADRWREQHLNPGAKLRAAFAASAQDSHHAVPVTLPDGSRRSLEPGLSSLILKGVVEAWAPVRLLQPVVLAISEPGDKVHVADERLLRGLGIVMDTGNVLPDALLADLGSNPVQFWIVEAVASDGPVSESRRTKLLDWAAQQNIKPTDCSFLTAFASRGHPATRKRLKDLAEGTWAWFADEPRHELAWYQLDSSEDLTGR